MFLFFFDLSRVPWALPGFLRGFLIPLAAYYEAGHFLGNGLFSSRLLVGSSFLFVVVRGQNPPNPIFKRLRSLPLGPWGQFFPSCS